MAREYGTGDTRATGWASQDEGKGGSGPAESPTVLSWLWTTVPATRAVFSPRLFQLACCSTYFSRFRAYCRTICPLLYQQQDLDWKDPVGVL